MRTCPYCAHSNMEGLFYCEECGQVLVGEHAAAIATQRLQALTGNLPGRNAWGTARFGREASIIIRVRDAADPLILEPKDEMVLGRSDSNNPATKALSVDLTPFGAQENGVSRVHAAIRRGEDTLTLVDLGSMNGTHLNGQRLMPNQPRVLRDGDEVRLGELVCHVYFKYRQPSSPSTGGSR